jgi:hypothetical protein
MFGPHLCSCVTHLDGYFATTSRPAPPALPEAQRLVRGSGKLADVPATPLAVKSLLAQGWEWFTISEPVAAATKEVAGWKFTIDPQAQRLDASNGSAKWSYVADARIGTEFAVVDGTVVIATHDGWAHCLDLATGGLKWRYLVAPAQRLIVANGMLTSAWPAFGVADLGNHQVVVSAGTHAELEGGIRVVGLNVADGALAWSKTLTKKPTHIAARGENMGGKRGSPIAEFSLINAAPTVEAGKVVIDGGAHLNRFEFSPSEAEDEITARMASQKRRG